MTRNSSRDEIPERDVLLFMTTSCTYYKIRKGEEETTVKQSLNSPW